MPLTKSEVAKIRTRLDRWELNHLRSHAAHLAEQLEAATDRANWAEQSLELWRHNFQVLQDEIMAMEFAPGEKPFNLGLMQDGQIVVVHQDERHASANESWEHGTHIRVEDKQHRNLLVLIRDQEKRHTWYAREAFFGSDGREWSTNQFGMVQDDFGQLVQVAA